VPTRYTVCSRPGCPELSSQGGRCDGCRTAAERDRGSAAQRGYDHRWRRTRDAYLDAHPFCVDDGCLTIATDVDHIDGKGPHGPRGHDWSNLRSLCHSHHSKRTARDQPGGWHAGI
jgi:5-methylcytosine-specific restriction protein A